MTLLLEEHRDLMRRRPLENKLVSAANYKITSIEHAKAVEDLLKMCSDAGALASTTIASKGEVVVFYKDGYGQSDSFEELHIRPQKDACILIAVFSAVSG